MDWPEWFKLDDSIQRKVRLISTEDGHDDAVNIKFVDSLDNYKVEEPETHYDFLKRKYNIKSICRLPGIYSNYAFFFDTADGLFLLTEPTQSTMCLYKYDIDNDVFTLIKNISWNGETSTSSSYGTERNIGVHLHNFLNNKASTNNNRSTWAYDETYKALFIMGVNNYSSLTDRNSSGSTNKTQIVIRINGLDTNNIQLTTATINHNVDNPSGYTNRYSYSDLCSFLFSYDGHAYAYVWSYGYGTNSSSVYRYSRAAKINVFNGSTFAYVWKLPNPFSWEAADSDVSTYSQNALVGLWQENRTSTHLQIGYGSTSGTYGAQRKIYKLNISSNNYSITNTYNINWSIDTDTKMHMDTASYCIIQDNRIIPVYGLSNSASYAPLFFDINTQSVKYLHTMDSASSSFYIGKINNKMWTINANNNKLANQILFLNSGPRDIVSFSLLTSHYISALNTILTDNNMYWFISSKTNGSQAYIHGSDGNLRFMYRGPILCIVCLNQGEFILKAATVPKYSVISGSYSISNENVMVTKYYNNKVYILTTVADDLTNVQKLQMYDYTLGNSFFTVTNKVPDDPIGYAYAMEYHTFFTFNNITYYIGHATDGPNTNGKGIYKLTATGWEKIIYINISWSYHLPAIEYNNKMYILSQSENPYIYVIDSENNISKTDYKNTFLKDVSYECWTGLYNNGMFNFGLIDLAILISNYVLFNYDNNSISLYPDFYTIDEMNAKYDGIVNKTLIYKDENKYQLLFPRSASLLNALDQKIKTIYNEQSDATYLKLSRTIMFVD